jgi:magnesium-transporting ATPase (P-type)
VHGTEAPTTQLGLQSSEAKARLRRDGPNAIPRAKGPSALRRLLSQFVHFFALLLWAAAGLAFVAGMPQLGIAIAVVIVINGVFAHVQESRAERAAQMLQNLLPRRVVVVRDGRDVEIDAAELVVGDLVRLRDGDRVSADLEIVEEQLLAIDTSMLTGESVPDRPGAGATAAAGTFVVEGEALAVVRATGSATRLAGISALTYAVERPRTPLALELDRVVRRVAAIAVGVGVLFFGLTLLVGTDASDGFLFAIGVTVALVPEGLLPTVTLSLAIGAQRMARRHALVRRLESVETLGSTTFICSDKTGTLTRNEMSVAEVWTPAGHATVTGTGYEPTGDVDAPEPDVHAAVVAAVRAARRCSEGRAELDDDGNWVVHGDPMEAAIDVLARRAHIDLDADLAVHPTRAVLPFDPHRRRMSAVLGGGPDTPAELVVKGAPEAVLGRCRGMPSGEGSVAEALEAMAAAGRRVLAVARRRLDPATLATLGTPGEEPDPDALETELELLGLLAFEDPPREGTADAIRRCREAGIAVGMLTGDHPRTARAIADRLGLRRPGDPVVDGSALPADEATLGAMVDHDGVVISRVAPEDKLRIARALQARGHVVAMTGDGVNDGPALHASDIGVAMGRNGTDVAREAADLVLLDDRFTTIVEAVDEGRATFANVRRFLTYHLTDNVAELTPFVLWALSGGRFPLALGVLQVLCLDIGTDLLPALALGAEPGHRDGMARPLTGRHLFDRRVLRRSLLVLGPVEATVSILAFLASMAASGWRPGGVFPTGPALATASGAAFTAVVLGQFANAFACRSEYLPAWHVPLRANPLLLGAVACEIVLLVVFLSPPVAGVLGHRAPSLVGFAVALLAPPAVLLADAATKARRFRRHPAPGAPAQATR